MDKRLIIVIAVLALAVILLSFGMKSIALKRSRSIASKIDAENEEYLLSVAKDYQSRNDYIKAKEAYKKLIKNFPDSKNIPQAQNEIENLNIALLFSDAVTEDSVSYEIKPGDTLGKIAAQFNTTVELIKKANNLKSDLIIPGRFLKVNNTNFNILVDKSDNTLTLKKSDGEVIKTYVVSTGKNFNTPTGTFRIEEKLVSPVWYKVGAIVEPDSAEYELGARWMGLSVAGYGIHGTNDPTTIGQHITKGCVRMRNKEVEELYAIVPSGTEVTIVD